MSALARENPDRPDLWGGAGGDPSWTEPREAREPEPERTFTLLTCAACGCLYASDRPHNYCPTWLKGFVGSRKVS